MYVQSDTLLLDGGFENFRNMYPKIYKLDPVESLSAPGLAWQTALKDTETKLDLFIDVDMILMVEKCIIGGICHSICRCAKFNNKYMKDYDKNKKPSYLQYWDVNHLYEWVMLQKLPVNNFEWIEDTYQFNQDFIKNFNEESDELYFLEVDFQHLEKLHEIHKYLLFLSERMNIEKVEKLAANSYDKTEYVIHVRNLKQTLNRKLVLKKVHKVIEFTHNASLKPYIDRYEY